MQRSNEVVKRKWHKTEGEWVNVTFPLVYTILKHRIPTHTKSAYKKTPAFPNIIMVPSYRYVLDTNITYINSSMFVK